MYKCNYCNSIQKTSPGLSNHIKRNHKKEHEDYVFKKWSNSKFPCDYCKLSYSNKGNLIRHKEQCHPIEYNEELIEKRKTSKFPCERCLDSFNSYDSLRKHTSRIHKIKSEDFYVEFHLNGIRPTCKCGCGENTRFTGHDFKDYKQGHISRIKNNWGHNPIAIQNSSNTRRKQFQNGERQVWNKGLDVTDDRVRNNVANLISKSRSKEERKRRSNQMKQDRLNGTIPTLYDKDHSQWKGGTSEISAMIYADNRLYKEWKFSILKEYNFQCNKCRSTEELHVHHCDEYMADIIQKYITGHHDNLNDFKVKKKIVGEVVDYHIRNNVKGEVLCRECHKNHHPSLNF